MRVLEHSFVELHDDNLLTKIELCGRVCYKSEDKITETSALNFVKKICVNNHGSVLEHYSFVLKVDRGYYDLLKTEGLNFFEFTNDNFPIVSFNLRAFMNYYNVDKNFKPLLAITKYLSSRYPDLFEVPTEVIPTYYVEEIKDFNLLNENERDVHQRISIKLTTDRGVTHELVRHRLASFSQESTRYCNYMKDKFGNEISVIKPIGITEDQYNVWKNGIEEAEKAYFQMLDNGATPQLARSVLPNSLKTDICITANIKEWKLIFDLRCSPAAHPDCKHIMTLVRDYFIEKGYINANN